MSDRTIAWLFISPTILLCWRSTSSVDLDHPHVVHKPKANWVDGAEVPPVSTTMSIFSPTRHLDLPCRRRDHFVFGRSCCKSMSVSDWHSDCNRNFAATAVDDDDSAADEFVTRRRRQFLDLPVSATNRLVNYVISFFSGVDPGSFSMIGDVKLARGTSSWSTRGCGAVRDADLSRRFALIPITFRSCRGRSRFGLRQSGQCRCRWLCRFSCWPCCSAPSKTSRCSTW